MTTKICSKCGEEKDLELYPQLKTSKDGKGAWCKECKRQYAKEKYFADPQAHRERCDRWLKNRINSKKD